MGSNPNKSHFGSVCKFSLCLHGFLMDAPAVFQIIGNHYDLEMLLQLPLTKKEKEEELVI